ncbi:MAG: hypothetical protein OQL27_03210 [Sedimenticola sp.]|nr:hypothetical protein [Sedimenticola sp.]
MALNMLQRIITVLLLCGLFFSLPAVAQKYRSQEGQSYNQNGRNSPSGVDLDSTVERIRKQTGGRVLHAETWENEGAQEHRVRIITDKGKVRRYRIDPGSGQELPSKRRR